MGSNAGLVDRPSWRTGRRAPMRPRKPDDYVLRDVSAGRMVVPATVVSSSDRLRASRREVVAANGNCGLPQ